MNQDYWKKYYVVEGDADAVFYLALAHGLLKSAAYQNAPAILTEKNFKKRSWKEMVPPKEGKCSFP